MKIGIISINAHTKVLNFASPLHTYVFQEFLNDNGIENVIIDYKPCYFGKFDVRHPYDHWMKYPKKNEKEQKELLEKWQTLYEDREERYDKFEKFIEEHYHKTDICYTQELLDEQDPGCDIYMCVTDVIWKYNPKNGFDRGFFLACDTMKGKGKIAYAASKGANAYTEEQTEEFKTLISDFDYISCREESLTSFVNTKIEQYAARVLDPVFLKDRDFYLNMAEEPEEKGYVLIYAVMDKAGTLVDEAMKFAQEHNLDVIDISDDKTILHKSKYGERTVKYNIGVEEWLGYMNNAAYIFTNSFHCCCFSIILNKQFYVGKRGGDKVDSVLNLFGLRSRKIAYGKTIKVNDIDFARVNSRLEKSRAESGEYVLKAISKTKHRIEHPILDKFCSKKLKGIQI